MELWIIPVTRGLRSFEVRRSKLKLKLSKLRPISNLDPFSNPLKINQPIILSIAEMSTFRKVKFVCGLFFVIFRTDI